MIDRFGNLVTNIDRMALGALKVDDTALKIEIGAQKQTIQGLSTSYRAVSPNKPLAIIGSKGLVEIAVNCGRADGFLNARRGDAVTIR